jgi:hypothetical protein
VSRLSISHLRLARVRAASATSVRGFPNPSTRISRGGNRVVRYAF